MVLIYPEKVIYDLYKKLFEQQCKDQFLRTVDRTGSLTWHFFAKVRLTDFFSEFAWRKAAALFKKPCKQAQILESALFGDFGDIEFGFTQQTLGIGISLF